MTDAPETAKPPLRVGLLIDSFEQPQWVFNVIRDIQSSRIAKVCVVVKNEATLDEANGGRLRSYWKNRNYLLYAFYNRLDARIRPRIGTRPGPGLG